MKNKFNYLRKYANFANFWVRIYWAYSRDPQKGIRHLQN